MKIEVGQTFHKKGNSYKYHIMAIILDDPETQVVFRYFGKYKQWWHYEIEYEFGFLDAVKIGLYIMD